MAIIQNIEMLIQEAQRSKVKYLFFWGHTPKDHTIVDKACFSQWYPAAFIEDNITYHTAEHYMMAKKAELFQDIAIRDQIVEQSHPNQAKALGRKVRYFDEKVWDEHKFAIVQQGNLLKFSQHAPLMEYLLQTGDRILVEASPYDKVWGIGMAQDHPHAEQPARWRGENLLGFALMAVREQLRKSSISLL
ncbi:NADAR family protein [Paenibacillus sp. 1001270B_150601_E10]|uniref:NADAR family protein n=1 Tax=Paenibacillus sp. 1001270B_150601_E10 TaxID=2787079 RepID=UPI00189F9476|nr:NADAR family protein [Paenibacillus sp. 1001270B_150601_E10]